MAIMGNDAAGVECAEPSHGWTRTIGGSFQDMCESVAAGPDGSVYIAGYYRWLVDFDPTEGVDMRGCVGCGDSDGFLTKLNADGSYGWTRTYEDIPPDQYSQEATAVAVGPQGNVFVAGRLHGSLFVSKVSANGSPSWRHTFAGGNAHAQDVAVGPDGSVVVIGDFRSTMNFDPSGGEDYHTASGETDIFVMKLGGGGNYGWTHSFGGPDWLLNGDDGNSIDIDMDGNVVVTGSFSGTADFDPTGGVDIRVCNGYYDIFVSKYLPNGSYAWTHTIGADQRDEGKGIVADSAGNILITGNFAGSVDFDPSGAVDLHDGGSRDTFVTKFGPDGSYAWTVTGYFGWGIDIDTGDNAIVTGHTGYSPRVTSLDPSGALAWAASLATPPPGFPMYAYGMAVDTFDNVLVTGTFQETVDFGGGDLHTSNGEQDVYVKKLLAPLWDEACDNTLFCDGQETCDMEMGCQPGSYPCTEPPHLTCNENADECVTCLAANDCDDGLFCNGAETCQSGACLYGLDPCVDQDHCDDQRDACLSCIDDVECLDDNPCTDDECTLNICVHTTVPGCQVCMTGDECEDGNPCTADLCELVVGEPLGVCLRTNLIPGASCPDDGNPCTDDECDGAGTCEHPNDNTNACDDGAFCNGAEYCNSGMCLAHPVADCNDNEVEDACDIEDGSSQDCNENDIPDQCDIAEGTSPDENGNGVPDECETAAGVHLDIKPGSCPNPVNPRNKGVVPMAIVGSESFDVTQIDSHTLMLRRSDGVGGIVTPLSGPPGPGITTGDVATPFAAELCDCHGVGGDGIDDLLLKFSTRQLAGAFELSGLPSGLSVMLTLTGSLLDGTAFEASDCVVIPGKPARTRPRGSRKR